jgi:hypothetical protein
MRPSPRITSEVNDYADTTMAMTMSRTRKKAKGVMAVILL